MTDNRKQWSTDQQKRLLIEKQILGKFFPNFQWINPSNSENTKVEGNLKANTQMFYKIRIYVPHDFPNSKPDLVAMTPITGYMGRDLKEVSREMHTLSPRDGFINICYIRSSDWVPSKTLYSIVIKGRLWLEALEFHKQTGEPIDQLLRHS
jgi:hypothetical protein